MDQTSLVKPNFVCQPVGNDDFEKILLHFADFLRAGRQFIAAGFKRNQERELPVYYSTRLLIEVT